MLPQCTVGHTQAGGGGIRLCGSFSWASLGPVVMVEQTMNATGYLNIIADQLHPYMTSVFPAGNGMFQQDNAPCHKVKVVLEWFQEHDAEFQLMSWPPNSPDINPIEHIWDVMGQQLRVQRPPIRNISDLRDRCLNIWYNLSPAIYPGLLASMPRRVEAVLRAKAIITNLIETIENSRESFMNDGNWDTCFETESDANEFLTFYLYREVDSYSAIFCFGKVKDKCKVLDFQIPFNIRFMPMLVETGPNSSIPICEVAIYKKDDKWCKYPPEVSVPNGQLEVNRSKAVLHCNQGFKEKDSREVYATCENNTWSYLSLQCVGKKDILCEPFLENVSPAEGEWKSVFISSEHLVRTKMTLSCKPGYQREGEPSTVICLCLQNGTWTRTTATCKREILLLKAFI
ncbi:unnamed protein product [Larinioides sclopetarius]|uniref:Sushi domain-containing protein n=1 Tax=Larinioides sclopetarius TaxID=280406 RepID=A0AAV2AN63_9ARAC